MVCKLLKEWRHLHGLDGVTKRYWAVPAVVSSSRANGMQDPPKGGGRNRTSSTCYWEGRGCRPLAALPSFLGVPSATFLFSKLIQEREKVCGSASRIPPQSCVVPYGWTNSEAFFFNGNLTPCTCCLAEDPGHLVTEASDWLVPLLSIMASPFPQCAHPICAHDVLHCSLFLV